MKIESAAPSSAVNSPALPHPDWKHHEDTLSAELPWFRTAGARGRGRASLRALIRTMDVLLSLVAIAGLLPFWILIALAIRIESPGPAFYRQERVGRGGRNFTMLKFRSMSVDREGDAIRLASPGDRRVTRLGAFLRSHRLDETPQFINVLRGEMSVVGPRPEIPSLAALGRERIPGYDERLRELPGITGLAQIVNGYDSDFEGVPRTVALDRHFIRHISLFNYLRILLRTVPTVLFCRGAV